MYNVHCTVSHQHLFTLALASSLFFPIIDICQLLKPALSRWFLPWKQQLVPGLWPFIYFWSIRYDPKLVPLSQVFTITFVICSRRESVLHYTFNDNKRLVNSRGNFLIMLSSHYSQQNGRRQRAVNQTQQSNSCIWSKLPVFLRRRIIFALKVNKNLVEKNYDMNFNGGLHKTIESVFRILLSKVDWLQWKSSVWITF